MSSELADGDDPYFFFPSGPKSAKLGGTERRFRRGDALDPDGL